MTHPEFLEDIVRTPVEIVDALKINVLIGTVGCCLKRIGQSVSYRYCLSPESQFNILAHEKIPSPIYNTVDIGITGIVTQHSALPKKKKRCKFDYESSNRNHNYR